MPGRQADPQSVESMPRRRDPAEEDLVLLVLRSIGGLLRLVLDLVLRHRLAATGLLACLVLLRNGGWLAVLVPTVVVGLAAVVLRLARPGWWSRWVAGPLWRVRRRRRAADSWRLWCRRCELELVERDRSTGQLTV